MDRGFEWIVPEKWLAIAREVLGSFNDERVFYFLGHDKNNKQKHEYIDTFLNGLISGKIKEACLLVHNSSDTKWHSRLVKHCPAKCAIRRRITFDDEYGNPVHKPTQGQFMMYFGDNQEEFKRILEPHGVVWMRSPMDGMWRTGLT